MRKLLLGVAASALIATGALAADPVDMVQPTYSSAGFDWDGFYAGLGVSGGLYSSGTTIGTGDLILGANVTSGNMLFGAEGWIGGAINNSGVTAIHSGAEVRAGYLFTPEALLYLSAGVDAFDFTTVLGSVGLGAEFAVTDNMSIDLEYKYVAGVGINGNTLGASLNWHF